MSQLSIPAVVNELLRLQGPTLRDLAANMEAWMAQMQIVPQRPIYHQQLHGWHKGYRKPIGRNDALLRAFLAHLKKRKEAYRGR